MKKRSKPLEAADPAVVLRDIAEIHLCPNLHVTGRIASFGMLHHVALIRTDVSEERTASIMVTVIGELGTTLVVTSNRRTLRRNTK
jgi:hypothetical protein